MSSDDNGPLYTGDPAEFMHHTELPDTAISRSVDRILDVIGSVTSWLWIACMAVILVSVIARYVFGQGSIMLEEIQWHIYGMAWLIGLSYTMISDSHVRVDVLHERFSLRTQTWIELLGLLLLLLPFLVIFLLDAVPYFVASYEVNERALAPDGLPARWALKFFLPLAIVLLILAAVSRLLKCTALLFGKPSPIRVTKSDG